MREQSWTPNKIWCKPRRRFKVEPSSTLNLIKLVQGKGKGRYSSSWEPYLRATGRHLAYGITQCYLPPDTSERAPPNPIHTGWYSIYLSRRDGRLGCPSWLDSAPAGSRTSDLSITSPTLNHCTTKTRKTVSTKVRVEFELRSSLIVVGAVYWIV